MKSNSFLCLILLFCLFASPPAFGFAPPAFETGADPGSTTLKPGDSCTNEDGVTVDNSSGSSGNVCMTPKEGSKKSRTTVTAKTNAEFTVTGIDENDTVNMGSSNSAVISGEGGTINMKGNSSATITNTSSGPNAQDITVNTPNGGTVTVKPGCTVPVTTP